MADLLIKQAELQKLDQLIGEIPTRYGYPLISFFQQVNVLRAQEAEALNQKENTKAINGSDLVTPGYEKRLPPDSFEASSPSL